ncbi:MAG TPA: PilZ domain-containing protein [Rhizomicrobium sp.]|jgi:hypothetical protein|nr:PilZ domain-containing protein [Rhizomicrobium sp.]
MTASPADISPSSTNDDQRDFQRVRTGQVGTVFVPPDGASHKCTIIDISPGGARVAWTHSILPETLTVLYIEGLGRFDAFVIRSEGAELGLFFVCGDEKRLKIQDKLVQYVGQGTVSPTRLRRHQRMPAKAFGHFTRADGNLVPCHVLDISLQGMSVQTLDRPPIGEIVNLGGAFGRVTRHFGDGIAIQFLLDVTKSAGAR